MLPLSLCPLFGAAVSHARTCLPTGLQHRHEKLNNATAQRPCVWRLWQEQQCSLQLELKKIIKPIMRAFLIRRFSNKIKSKSIFWITVRFYARSRADD
jgi:hypothetical protein